MVEATRTRRERVQAGLAGFTTAFAAWPVLAAVAMLVLAGLGAGWELFGMLVIGLYGWIVISLAATVIGAFVGGPANEVAVGVLKIVSIAVGCYLVFGLLVMFA